MARIFLTLASLSLILLLATLIIGLTMGHLYGPPEPSLETLRLATIHRLTGLAAALAVVFVECVVMTYFIGTGRWCKEVVETYHLDPALVAASNRLKRRTFPWVLAAMLAVVGIIALGGAADPGARGLTPATKTWADWHLLGALLGIVFVAWTYLLEWNNIVANHAIIEQVVTEVSRLRQERGLNGGASSAQIPTARPSTGSQTNR